MKVGSRFWGVNRVSQTACGLLFAVLAASTLVSAQSNSPALLYASAKAGPNQGWANSSTQGAAITVWGKNLGATRGSSYVTIGGVNLTANASYAEWGATTNPQTTKGFQRISFWLNSTMPVGVTTISVTVGGVTSNTLPFTIDNTAAANIRFVDPANGSESYDGQYPDHSLGGSHGPWQYPSPGNNTASHPGVGPGTFIYLRGGTYTSVCPSGSGYHCPRGGIFGNEYMNGTQLAWYSGPINGTDALRITMTEYPGEHAHFFNVWWWVPSSYWTFTNFTMDGDLSDAGTGDGNVYMAIVFGTPDEYCTGVTYRNNSDQMIGLAIVGNIHIPFQLWGIGNNVLATYLSNIPTAQGLGIEKSYNFYIASTTNTLIKDNEMHRGAYYKGQIYDESRCYGSPGQDADRGIRNLTFDSNWLDMNQSDVTPYPINDGVIIGMGATGIETNPDLTNITLSNNVIYRTDSNGVIDGVNFYQEGAPVTINGLYVYNNTFYNTNRGVGTMTADQTTASNVAIENNIFSNITDVHFYNSSSGKITPVWAYNLTDKALSISGAVNNQGHNVLGNPQFVSTTTPDFHISSSSPAKDAGLTIPSITVDYDGVPRPQGSGYDIGAFEYLSGSTQLPSPPTGLAAVVN